MNSIPITFDEHQINRTVVGGLVNKDPDALNISVILLNTSGSHFKVQLFENLLSCNFHQIVSVEHDAKNFALDDLAKKYPTVKFIVPLEKATDGEMINLAMSEISSDYALVIRDSLNVPSGFLHANLAEKLVSEDIFCIVPRLLDSGRNGLITHYSPTAIKSRFVIEASSLISDGMRTVYPHDFIGLYNRKKFIQLGGFDYTIKSAYWQILDLALRSWLWGEETRLTTLLQFSYATDKDTLDKTVNKDYLRYYLKNELPKFRNDKGVIKNRQFIPFLFHSGCGYLEARKLFKAAKIWVEKNKYRYKSDLPGFVENWRNL